MKNYTTKTTTTLTVDNGKKYMVGMDIAFLYRKKKYIGEITEIFSDSISLKNIEIQDPVSKKKVGESFQMIVNLDDIEDNSCRYVACD